MLDLLGSAAGLPCGTCNNDKLYYSIGFGGSLDNYKAWPKGFSDLNITTGVGLSKSSVINVPSLKVTFEGEEMGVFEAVNKLAAAEKESGAADSSKVQDLALNIATTIRDAAVDMLSKNKVHFDRVLPSGSYDMIVYDYRDCDRLLDQKTGTVKDFSAADSYVLTWANAEVTTPVDMMWTDTYELEESLRIQCSDQIPDFIPIKLPEISLDYLGLADYSVANYKTTIINNDDYNLRHALWEEDFKHEEGPSVTIMSRIPEYETTPGSSTYINGEHVYTPSKKTLKGFTEVPVTVRTSIVTPPDYPEPRPDPSKIQVFREYDPSKVELVTEAIKNVSSLRSYLGAIQNRLEHAYANNQNKLENTTSSESRIRDTDMAKEMVQFSNRNILEQAGQAMLSQANRSKDYILSLLQ
ncbi:MAG: hypothetical protein K5985_02265 [Lachnospiraceae bacterium]|nr:hypothetical protein [Lachnospiraceae bacterium]